jgi:hypothetical protein
MIIIVGSITTAAAVALGGYWVGRSREPHSVERSQSPVVTHEVEKVIQDPKLAGSIASMQRRLAELEAKQAANNAAQRAAPPSEAAIAAEPFDPAMEEQRRLDREAAIAAALESEPRDKSWASPTESSLRAAVESAVHDGAKFSVEALNCQTTVCEMVLTASDSEELKYVARQLAPKVVGMHSLDVLPPTPTPDGRATVTCRFFRQGYPRPDEAVL